MKSRRSPFLSILSVVLASNVVAASGCVDQEQGFYVANFNSPKKEDDGSVLCSAGDPQLSYVYVSTSSLNADKVHFECIEFGSNLGRPNAVSSVDDNTDPYAIILDRAEIDLLRGDVPVESFDFTLSGRVLSGVEGDPHFIPIASAATAASLGGSLGAGETIQLDVEIRAFGHTAGGLDIEAPPFRTQVLYTNE